MNLELRELVKAGATDIQIDEPYYSGFPEDLAWGIRAINTLVAGVDARIGLHICYGNRYGKPAWEGSYRYLFPAVLEARVQQLTLEFGRRGEEDVPLFREFEPPFTLGLGVIDVKIARRGDAGDRGRAHPQGPARSCPPSGWPSTRTAGSSTCRATWPSPSSARWWRAPALVRAELGAA